MKIQINLELKERFLSTDPLRIIMLIRDCIGDGLTWLIKDFTITEIKDETK